MTRLLHGLMALAAFLAFTATAQAQFDFLPEIRGGVFAQGVGPGNAEGVDLLDPELISHANGELLFNLPDMGMISLIGEFRPHVGATVSLRDKDSYAYAGMSYTFQAPVLPVFAEASLGAVAHSTLLSAPEGDAARAMGCGIGLRVAGSVGLNLPFGASVIGTVEHLPDFGTCNNPERAATNVGVRLGLRF